MFFFSIYGAYIWSQILSIMKVIFYYPKSCDNGFII